MVNTYKKDAQYHESLGKCESKTTIRYHLTLISKAIIKKPRKQLLARVWKNWSPRALLAGRENGAATMKTSVESPQKIKNRIRTGSGNSTAGYVPQRLKAGSQGDIYTPVCTASLSTIGKTWKQCKYPPRSERAREMQYTHKHGHLSASDGSKP